MTLFTPTNEMENKSKKAYRALISQNINQLEQLLGRKTQPSALIIVVQYP